jgi:hypothetical protein
MKPLKYSKNVKCSYEVNLFFPLNIIKSTEIFIIAEINRVNKISH